MKISFPHLIAGIVVVVAASHAQPKVAAPSVDPHATETTAQRDARMKWWREARFGMFIHWGLYALPAGEWKGRQSGGAGEWMMHDFKIPVADYATLAPQFNPQQFDADAWVNLAKAAGMKYIVMTAKHHEGFAMYPSKADPFNIFDATPFKRDPIAEMAAACKKQGLKFGVYYSQAQDWHQPGGAAYDGHWDTAQNGDLHAYVQKVAVPQVRELLTKYHPAVLWWDTPVEMLPEDIKALTAAFASEPQLIANNRLGNGVPGDTETPEQHIPATGYPGRDWETCMTINNTWGYKTNDLNFKSSTSLLRNLIDIASKGGNYLLNVGPDGRGIIPEAEAKRLQVMGTWLKTNGASIYATTASPYKRLPFEGRCTVKGDKMYLNVFSWPDDGLTLAGLQTAVKSATVLATGQKLTVSKDASGTLALSRPSSLDAVSTTVELSLAGPPVVVEPVPVIQALNGEEFRLDSSLAKLEGGTISLEGEEGRNNIGYWTNMKDSVSWRISNSTAGVGGYSVQLDYACAPGSEGSTFSVLVDGIDSGLTGTVAKTNGWEDYRSMTLEGKLTLTTGLHTISIVPKSKPGLGVMNLRSMQLKLVNRYTR
ncbi:carbohydrate-binding protein [bacterium]|nr:MAG: carbohydrate-binding protein [bacterium]